ncbi:Polynucleotidyl transferase, ribonuclease H superfamily protein [Trifolium repens]|nr:Polynucleotidyl transferase, ribonuclease H superfamily protein [Trifolium repens]
MGLGNPMCVYCGTIEETILHVLRDCPLVLHVWMRVVPINRRGEFFMSDLKDWIGINLNNTDNNTNGALWCDFWALTCYCFWSWKNKEAHDPHFIRPVNAIQHVFKLGGSYREAMHVNQVVSQHVRVASEFGWAVPVSNFVKLNTDGASKEGKIAGCGGVIRGSQGEWLGGFAKHIGSCSDFTAELWGVVEGLCLAQRLAFSKVELCIDSQAVVQVIESGRTRGTTEYALLKKIRGLLALEWEVKISHVYRESNRCADALVNIGCSLNHNILFYFDCPVEIRDIMSAAVLGITTPRMIVI